MAAVGIAGEREHIVRIGLQIKTGLVELHVVGTAAEGQACGEVALKRGSAGGETAHAAGKVTAPAGSALLKAGIVQDIAGVINADAGDRGVGSCR